MPFQFADASHTRNRTPLDWRNDRMTREARSGFAQSQMRDKLTRLRAKAEALSVSWQNVRARETTQRIGAGLNAPFGPGDSLQWSEAGLDCFRWAFADSFVERMGKGWYDSEHCEEVYRGAVLRTTRGTLIPAVLHGSDSRKHGWQNTCGNRLAVMIAARESYDADDSVACARRADQLAERLAESEREYQQAADAALKAQELASEIQESRRETLEGLAELRRARRVAGANAENFPHICETMKRQARAACLLISRNRKKIARLREDFGSSQGFRDHYA